MGGNSVAFSAVVAALSITGTILIFSGSWMYAAFAWCAASSLQSIKKAIDG